MNSATGSVTCTLPHTEQLGVVTTDLWQVYGRWENTTPWPSGSLRTGGSPATGQQHGRQRTRPLVFGRAKAPSVGLSNARFISLGLPTLIDGC
jgi:hypothetical protein